MKRLLWLIPLAALSLTAGDQPLSRDGEYWVETVSGGLAFAGRDAKIVASGTVTMQGIAEPKVAYQVRKRVRARSATEARRLLRQVTVQWRGTGDLGQLTVFQPVRHPGLIDVTVQLPRVLRTTSVFTRGGEINAFDLDGSVQLESDAGNIELDRIGGAAVAKTGGGEIRAGTVDGQLRCISGGGTIRALKVGGSATLETQGGEIEVGETGGPVQASTAGGNIRIRRAGATVVAQTMAGRIAVEQARGMVSAANPGGGIEIGAAPGVRIEASGAIRLRGTSGALQAATGTGDILAEFMAGSELKDSLFSTANGDVTLFIPSNFPVTVRALNEKGRWARIVSEFPEFAGQRVARPAFEACLNGCGPVLRISANGTIYLRRSR